MPFGLTNAPAAFQRLVNTVFRKYDDVFVVVYLDDILIYSTESRIQHVQHVIAVLKLLRENNLFARANKCEFDAEEVEYLGFKVTKNGIMMDPGKVEVVREWRPPTNVKGVRGFLGLANFYRRFISDYSNIVVPLYHLLKKDTPYSWSPACQKAFDLLKDRFTTAPILAHFDASQEHILETDASDYAVGAVLLQKDTDDSIRPVGFISRTMNSAERNYPIFDKEMLAIFWAFQEWRPMLLSCSKTVTVVTDHRAITYFMSSKVLNRRQARWAELLADYDFVVRYRPGEQNGQADALSRREDVCPSSSEGGSSYAANNPSNIRPLLEPRHLRVTAVYNPDELLERIKTAQENDTSITAIKKDLQSTASDIYSIKDNLPLHDQRIYVPNDDSIKLDILRARHDHPTAGRPGRNKTFLLV